MASAFLLPCSAQLALLQLRVIEGEGTVHAPGSRSVRPLTVQVTDETGRPVEGAAVTFHLPNDGPGGTFPNGLRTEVSLTDAAGRASIRTLDWNTSPGRFQIRIVAAREQARAGIVSYQYIADTGKAVGTRTAVAGRRRSMWIVVAAVLAAGATAGVVNGTRSKSGAPAAPPPPAPASVSVGAPAITVGTP